MSTKKSSLSDKEILSKIDSLYQENIEGNYYINISFVVSEIDSESENTSKLEDRIKNLLLATKKYTVFTDTEHDDAFVLTKDFNKVKEYMSDNEFNSVKNQKENMKMSSDHIGSKVVDLVKKANKEATKRNGVRALGIATAKGVKALVKASKVNNPAALVFSEVIETKEGTALLKGGVGFIAAFCPSLAEDELLQILAEEARTQFIEDVHQIIGNKLETFVVPLLSKSLETLRKDPAIKQMLKDRKLASQDDE